MKDRIKEIRKENNLTQTEFAERISMKQNSIAQIELGRRIPSTLAIQAICREFRVSQLWLETGVEPKYIDVDEEDIEVANRNSAGQRVKEIRKDNNMTQEDFGNRIGIKRNSLAQIETGVRPLSNLVCRAICREFRVSQLWLETGVEPKYIDVDEEDIEVVNSIMEGQSKNKKELVRIIANMPDELFDAVYDYIVNRKLR